MSKIICITFQYNKVIREKEEQTKDNKDEQTKKGHSKRSLIKRENSMYGRYHFNYLHESFQET